MAPAILNSSPRLEAVCVSVEKGTAKTPAAEAELAVNHGLRGDAHAGTGHRQVSLLSAEVVDEFNAKNAGLGVKAGPGAFGENLLVRGLDMETVPVGTLMKIGEAVLEITQHGKECHAACAIRRLTGDCVMPRAGVFARVLRGGVVKPGDSVECAPVQEPRLSTAVDVQ